ncbi:MAG: hypothetical protein Q4G03_02190 [Planctomycetia bacterium]|nr:hypothetical protein [Planctomycetia bacterium]
MPLSSPQEVNPNALNLEDDLRQARERYFDYFETEEEFQEALELWPRCPRCGRRRVARCPVCKNKVDFAQIGDSQFWVVTQTPRQVHETPSAPTVPVHSATRTESYAQREAQELQAAFGSAAAKPQSHEQNDAQVDANPSGVTEVYLDSIPLDAEPISISVNAAELIPGLPNLERQTPCENCHNDVFDDLSDSTMTPEAMARRRRAWARVNPALQNLEAQDATENNEAPLAVCNVCSEAFTPHFEQQCEHCGYDFGPDPLEPTDSVASVTPDVEEFLAKIIPDDEYEQDGNTRKLFFTIVAIMIAGVLGACYVAFVLR